MEPSEDLNVPGYADIKGVVHQPYLQRSISAPAIAEHVSEAVLPSFNLEANVDVNSGSMQYASRLNRRIPPFSKKDIGSTDFTSFFADGSQQPPSLSLLNESLAEIPRDILTSLMADSQGRAPLELIQHDFPGTPSAIFSNRLSSSIDQEKEEAQEVTLLATDVAVSDGAVTSGGEGSPRLSPLPTSSRLPAIMSSTATNDDALEEAAKSLQKLYVNPAVNPDASLQSAQAVPQPNAALLSQYTSLQHAAAHAQNSFFHQGQTPGLLSANSPAFVSSVHAAKPLGADGDLAGGFSLNPNAGNAASATAAHGMPFIPSPAVDLTGALNKFNTYNSLQLAMMSGLQNAFVANTNAAAAFGNGFPAGQVASNMNQLNPQQPPFYPPQQPLYVNNNGQPVYYRPAGNGSGYGQEFVYTPNAVEGGVPVGTSQVMMGADQQTLLSMQGNYLQYQQSLANQVHANFWSGQQSDQTSGLPMFIPSQQGVVPGVRMPDDPNSRMLFTAQYGNAAVAAAAANGGYGMLQMAPNPMAQRPADVQQVEPAHTNNVPRSQFEDHRDNRNRDHHNNGHHRDNRNEGRGHRGDRDGRGGKGGAGGGGGGGNNGAARDALVEEFRTTFGKSRQWTLRDLAGHVVAFCQDQHGSRFIQQRLEICTDAEKQLVFDEIMPSAQVLMTDVFGNYVLQKIFEYGAADQCEALALLLRGQAVQLSMQMYGCRVVQKALEYVSTERLVELVSEFENPQMLIKCVHDSNGNHVIQKCIEVVSKAAKAADSAETVEYLSSRIQFIITAFQGRVKELSSHPYGCRVVQRILEHCTEAQKAVILEELRQCCGELVQDCYGNYVIQFVMQHGWEEDRAALIREVQSNLLDFSQHKFASNVVEKCLQYASKKDRDEMIWTIINVTFDLNNPVDSKGHCVLESMVRDPYANYVVQKVIDVSDERQRAAIMRYVKDNINQLRKYTYGKHIIVRLEKITNEKF